ncbi:MAG: tryptophan synthase subunit alpha [Gammaproteobacteria bacterium]|nr:tryptophan synthase subunit alpha [Gammaproteobacteria bacterium]
MSLQHYLADCHEQLGDKNRRAMLMTHVVCGYPSFEDNWQALEVMQEFGVELVELQFPFSEPSADGPLFVKANQSAIDAGVHVADCFAFMRKVSNHFSFKVIMMGYYNTVFKTGSDSFLKQLKEAGGEAFILPDLPVDEAGELHSAAAQYGLDPILLMTPTNTDERLQQLANAARGFIYTVARKGVTGSSTDMNQDLAEFIKRCRQHTDLPLAVGFGVSKKSDIDFIGEHADIAVIGTAALQAWEQGGAVKLREFFTQLTQS